MDFLNITHSVKGTTHQPQLKGKSSKPANFIHNAEDIYLDPIYNCTRKQILVGPK